MLFMLMMLLLIISVIKHLISGNNLNWILSLNLSYETLTGTRSGFLNSVLGKPKWFCLTGQIVTVLSVWKWMGLFSRKNHVLRCLGWSSILNLIGAHTLYLLLKLPPRKLELSFVLCAFISPQVALYLCKSTIHPCIRLRHMKNKGVRQSHVASLTSEAIDIWKVARDPPSRCVAAWDDYSFYNTTVSFLLEWDVRTIIKSKLEQASKEFQKEFHCEQNTRKASQNVFYVCIAISQSSRGFKASLERCSRMKYCFSDQTCIK